MRNVYLFELFADEGEGFVDGVGVAGHGHDPLGAGAIADVDLGATLRRKKELCDDERR